jgi:hypothetical protein
MMKKKKYHRRKWSEHQIEVMRAVYLLRPCPSTLERQSLAMHFDCSPRSVQVWFQNQRQRNEFVPTSTTFGDALWLISDGEDD